MPHTWQTEAKLRVTYRECWAYGRSCDEGHPASPALYQSADHVSDSGPPVGEPSWHQRRSRALPDANYRSWSQRGDVQEPAGPGRPLPPPRRNLLGVTVFDAAGRRFRQLPATAEALL